MWSGFVRLNDDGTPYDPSIKEILRLVSGWFVKKDNKYHDVNNLQTSYQAQDLKQVIVSRIKVLFPNLHLTNKDLKEFFLVLLDPADQPSHHSARSANKLTYGLYSAGISDAQKREIIEGIRLPDWEGAS